MRTLGKVEEGSLHFRASVWFEKAGYIVEAVQHALDAKDWERSIQLIQQASDGLLKRGELLTLINWCEKLPDDLLDTQTVLGLSYAWALSLLGRFDAAELILLGIERQATAIPSLLGQVAATQSFVARGKGDNARAIEKSRQALALLPLNDSQLRGVLAVNLGLIYWHEGLLREATQVLEGVLEVARKTGNQYGLLTSQIFLARTLASEGKLRQAEQMYRQILREGDQIPILTLAYYDLCGIYYEWNDLEEARKYLEIGLELSTRSGNVEFQNSGHILNAILSMACGKPQEAMAEAEVSHSLARGFNPATQARSAACHAQLALASGDIDTAAHWAALAGDGVDAHPFYRFLGLIQPRLLLARGEKESARKLLQASYETASQGGWDYARIAVRILQTLAAEPASLAFDFLVSAIRLSQPDGYLRAFVDSGRSLIPYLQKAASQGIFPEYVGQILAGFGRAANRPGSPEANLVESLSQREIEVLRLITAGLSNREIAAQLYISPGTAKTHIHNICGKLAVRNRTEAAIRAKALNLV